MASKLSDDIPEPEPSKWESLMSRFSQAGGYTLWDAYWHRWHARAVKRATRKSERYAEIQAATHTSTGLKRYDKDLFDEEHEIFWRINRRPVYWYIHHWWQNHGIRAKESDIRVAAQRAKRGWSDRDVWSLDSYLNDVFIGSLAHLRDTDHGHPGHMTAEQWTDTLNEMITGFQAAKDVNDLKYETRAEADALIAKFEAGMDLVKENWFSLWD